MTEDDNQPISPSRQAWAEFMAMECCVCHGAKLVRNGFCRACYFRLPKALQKPMWKRFGDGYETAHAAAREWLRAHPRSDSAAASSSTSSTQSGELS